MYEHAIAVAAEEERNGFVHELVLDAHAVARPRVDLLTALVEARERLAAAENLFVVLQLEGGGCHAAEVARAPDEGERDGREVCRRVADGLRARQEVARVVVELDVPRVFDEPHLTVSARVRNALVGLLGLPSVVGRRRADEHERVRVARHLCARSEA